MFLSCRILWSQWAATCSRRLAVGESLWPTKKERHVKRSVPGTRSVYGVWMPWALFCEALLGGFHISASLGDGSQMKPEDVIPHLPGQDC